MKTKYHDPKLYEALCFGFVKINHTVKTTRFVKKEHFFRTIVSTIFVQKLVICRRPRSQMLPSAKFLNRLVSDDTILRRKKLTIGNGFKYYRSLIFSPSKRIAFHKEISDFISTLYESQ